MLEWVARFAGSDCSAENARLVARRTLMERLSGPAAKSQPDTEWLEFFTEAVSALHLRVQAHHISEREILRDAQFGTASVTHVLDDAGHGVWLVLSKIGRNRFHAVVRTSRRERSVRLKSRQVWAFLAEYGAEGLRTWLYVEPLFALEQLRVDATHVQISKHTTAWRRLRELMKLERSGLWIVFVHALVVGLLTLVSPIATQSLVNTVAFGSLIQPLVVLTMLLLIALTFRAAVGTLEVWAVEMLQRRIFVRVSEDFGERLSRVHASARSRLDMNEMTHRFYDVISVNKASAILLLDGLSLLLQLSIGTVLLAFYHPFLLAFDLVLVALLFFITFGLAPGAVSTAIEESYAKHNTANWLHTIAQDDVVFRSRGGQRYAATRTQVLCREFLTARRKHFRVLLRHIIGGFGLQILAMVSLLGVGGFLVIERQLTLGQLVAAELLIGAIGVGFSKVGKHLETLYNLLASLDKIGSVLDLPIEEEGKEPLSPHLRRPCTAEMRGFSLAFPSGKGSLRAEKLAMYPGDRVTLSGPSASGKTRLLHCLWGELEHYEGSLRIDGVDRKHADPASWRDAVVLVSDRDWFQGTVAENLSLGDLSLSKERMWQVLSSLSVAECVRSLPGGLESKMHPSGAPFSSSQLRLLGLARSLLQAPRLLLIDGLLDHLPLPQLQRENIFETLLGQFVPWSVLLVSNDPDVARYGSRQWEIQDGWIRDLTPKKSKRFVENVPPSPALKDGDARDATKPPNDGTDGPTGEEDA